MIQNWKCYVDYISFVFSDICTRSVAEAQLVQNREIKTEGLSILPHIDINMPASWLVKLLLKYDLVEGCLHYTVHSILDYRDSDKFRNIWKYKTDGKSSYFNQVTIVHSATLVLPSYGLQFNCYTMYHWFLAARAHPSQQNSGVQPLLLPLPLGSLFAHTFPCNPLSA